MTKADFVSKAQPVSIVINGVAVPCEVREFSTGSVGFILSGKVPLTLPDGSKGELMCNGNLVLIGSKKLPAGEVKAAA